MRSHVGILVAMALTVIWSVRCGSSGQGAGSSTGGNPDAGTQPDAGSGPADAGAGGGGGPADGGSGGGSADAGSGGGGGGGGSADAGSGGGGSPDAGSGGGGGTAAACEGVVPDRLGSSFSFEVPGLTFPGAQWTCDRDTTDEKGNVASHLVYGKTYTDQRWHLFDSNGAHQAEFHDLDLFPQGEGFEGIHEQSTEHVPIFRVSRWAPDGSRSDGPAVGGEIVPKGLRAWPNGLMVLVADCHRPDFKEETVTLRRFDAALNELGKVTVTLPCAEIFGAVEDANNNRLLLASGAAAGGQGVAADDLVGSWFDSSGKSLTGWFRIGPGGAAAHEPLFHALIGGGAAIRVDGAWTYFVPSGKAEAQPAPAFLKDNPDTDFTLIRDARAYAVLPRRGDTTTMKLYSSSGDLCGPVKFPSGGLTTGADGSVISSSGDHGCGKTVWPGLLR